MKSMKTYWKENEKEIRQMITNEQKSHVEDFSKKINIFRHTLMKFLNSIFARYKKCTTTDEIEKCLNENLIEIVNLTQFLIPK